MVKENKNAPCLINKDNNTIKGKCVILASKGYASGCKIKENGKWRKCTESDMIRNQGFPLSFKFVTKNEQLTKTKLNKVLGESFPPKAAKKIGKQILKKLLDGSLEIMGGIKKL